MTIAVKATQASAQVKDKPGLLYAVVLTAGADAASVTVYNNTAGSGDKVAVLKAAAGTSASWCPAQPIACSKGLYATVTGTTPDVSVAFV
jgi:hypothetical protein